jgi:ubiquitin-conjugating enzyme E2 variant
VWVFAIVGANANQVHKWNHMPKDRRPLLIRGLQQLRLLQSPRDHAAHHRGEKNTAYCVITPFLNPLLDATRFWRGLEKLTVPWIGAPRREDLLDAAHADHQQYRS